MFSYSCTVIQTICNFLISTYLFYFLKLRISSHKLPAVESGRYNNIPFDQRICKHCNLNVFGNEQHYLMQCSYPIFNKYIDNSMVSSAIWKKHARVSFSKTIKIARVRRTSAI